MASGGIGNDIEKLAGIRSEQLWILEDIGATIDGIVGMHGGPVDVANGIHGFRIARRAGMAADMVA